MAPNAVFRDRRSMGSAVEAYPPDRNCVIPDAWVQTRLACKAQRPAVQLVSAVGVPIMEGSTMYHAQTIRLTRHLAIVVGLLACLDDGGWFRVEGSGELCAAEPPGWVRVLGGSDDDFVESISSTPDGGCILAGYTRSFGLGSDDLWVVRLNKAGRIVWQKSYGGADREYGGCVVSRVGGGYYVAGHTKSSGAGWYDGWIMRLDARSRIVWQKTYGTWHGEWIDAARETREGSLITVGGTYAAGAGSGDIWIMKLTSSGNMVWQRTFGGPGFDYAFSVELTPDGGYIVGGSTASYGAGSWDYWIIKLDATGDIQWQKAYGAGGVDRVQSVIPTPDGGYLASGWTYSYGDFRIWILKLGSSGGVQWQKLYDGAGSGRVLNMIDGNYLLLGYSGAFKLDTDGNLIWGKAYPGPVFGLSSAVVDEAGQLYIAVSGQQFGREDFGVVQVSADGLTGTDCDGRERSLTIRDTQAWVAPTRCKVTTPPMQTKSSKVGNVNSFASAVDPCQ